MTNDQLKIIAEKVLHRNFDTVQITDSPNVFAKRTADGKETAGGKDVPQKLRALTLLCREKGEIEITQTPHFDRLGVFLDVSRLGVMRVDMLKEYMEKIALYGANYVILHMEDLISLPEYPHYGYVRGAYSDDELREIDDYAYSLGLELIPAVQTLGHMGQYLSWGVPGETAPIMDTDNILLCDSPDTEKFLRTLIAKISSVFRTEKIHVGMDEAGNLGFGQYYKKHGYVDKYEIFSRHFKLVYNICKENSLKPMMWSDMFFITGGDCSYEYSENFVAKKEAADDMAEVPEMQVVYWDYFQEKKARYDMKIKAHKDFKRDIIFAGGLWTWGNVLPDYKMCFEAMIPAMQSCVEHGIRDVFACCWGDDGCESDYFRAIYSFAIFSEYCYCENEPSEEHIRAMGEIVSGISTETVLKVEKYRELPHQKKIYSGDIFFNTTSLDFSKEKHFEICSQMAEKFQKGEDECARLLFKISALKAKIYEKMLPDYKAGKDLSVYEKEILPELLTAYRDLSVAHGERWLEINKVFGYERIAARYAIITARIEYAIDKIAKYSRGEIAKIEELEYTPVYGNGRSTDFNKTAFGASMSMSY